MWLLNIELKVCSYRDGYLPKKGFSVNFGTYSYSIYNCEMRYINK